MLTKEILARFQDINTRLCGGRGSRVLDHAIMYLERDEVAEAKHYLAEYDHDKIRQYPELHRFVQEVWDCCDTTIED